MEQSIVLSIDEAARALSIGKTKLYALIGAGEIPAQKLGKRTILTRQNLNDYIASLEMYPLKNRGA